MKCERADIQERLPGYRELTLGPEERELVRKHLDLCPDCRMELELLSTMTGDLVPDPGEEFWRQMPAAVRRSIRIERDKAGEAKRRPSFLAVRLFPRIAWAGAAMLIIAALSVVLFRPSPQGPVLVAGAPAQDGVTAWHDITSDETVNLAEMSAPEVDKLNEWATRGLSSFTDELDTSTNGEDADLDDELRELSPAELEQLLRLLESRKREV